jgi:hypothetical protein
MRRLMHTAAFAVLLALPLWAQHSGPHAGGGHGGGFSSGHAFGGMHSSPSSSRGFTHAPSFSQRSFANRGFSNRGFSGRPFLHDGFRGHRIRTHGFRNNCFGYRCWGGYGYPWGYGGYYDPYWWWDSGSSYDEDYERERAVANEMNQQNLEEQRMLHQEQADGDRDLYSRSTPDSRPVAESRPAPGDPPQGTAIMSVTVLVFRDQHEKEIQNYAIVGQTLWDFVPQHTEKIPLSDLDLPATTQANDERGVTFRVPTSNEAQ